MGLSVGQVRELLVLLLGVAAAPSRSAVGRWTAAAGLAAGRVLARLDARRRELVLDARLDEIFFHGRPVLVAVEPALRDRAWRPVVNHLRAPSGFTFPNRTRAELEALPIASELRSASLEPQRPPGIVRLSYDP